MAKSKRRGQKHQEWPESDSEADSGIGAGIVKKDKAAATSRAPKPKGHPRRNANWPPRRSAQTSWSGSSRRRRKRKSSPSPRPTPPPPPLPTPSPEPPMSRAIPLLICSVGNPGSAYSNTLHSAGHTVLKKLSERLEFQPYQKSRPHGSGLVSKPVATGDSDWMLWQSTSLMNISGKGVKAAHNTWAQDKPAAEGESAGKLVIVHDELEKPLGAVNLNVRQGASAKGHNGLKSIMSSIGNVPFVRIGIGIGRPVSRESKDVANYVMRKMTPVEKAKIEGSVEEVIAKLKELEGT